jgi:hypothetical protein
MPGLVLAVLGVGILFLLVHSTQGRIKSYPVIFSTGQIWSLLKINARPRDSLW